MNENSIAKLQFFASRISSTYLELMKDRIYLSKVQTIFHFRYTKYYYREKKTKAFLWIPN